MYLGEGQLIILFVYLYLNLYFLTNQDNARARDQTFKTQTLNSTRQFAHDKQNNYTHYF